MNVATHEIAAVGAHLNEVYPLLPFNDGGRMSLVAAAVLWTAGFTLYFVRFVPVMFSRRS